MVTCLIRYTVDPTKLDAFEAYARAWMTLIEKYGGTHHGYFRPARPGEPMPDAKFSYPGLGRDGPPNTGAALFSFPSVAAYESYRERVKSDPELFSDSTSFTAYERNFLVPVQAIGNG